MNNEPITKLDNGMTRESLIFSIACILDGALDIVQMGMPDSVDTESRRDQLRNDDDDIRNLTEYERGAVSGALSAVSIIVAQSIDDGIGHDDADQLLGDFYSACEKFVASNWSSQGDTLRYRLKRKIATSPNGWDHSDIYLDYPNTKAMATRLVTELNIE